MLLLECFLRQTLSLLSSCSAPLHSPKPLLRLCFSQLLYSSPLPGVWASLWDLDGKFRLPPGSQEATANQNISSQTHSLFSSFKSALLFFLRSRELYPPAPLGLLHFPSLLPAPSPPHPPTPPPLPHASPLRQDSACFLTGPSASTQSHLPIYLSHCNAKMRAEHPLPPEDLGNTFPRTASFLVLPISHILQLGPLDCSSGHSQLFLPWLTRFPR